MEKLCEVSFSLVTWVLYLSCVLIFKLSHCFSFYLLTQSSFSLSGEQTFYGFLWMTLTHWQLISILLQVMQNYDAWSVIFWFWINFTQIPNSCSVESDVLFPAADIIGLLFYRPYWWMAVVLFYSFFVIVQISLLSLTLEQEFFPV